MKKTGGKQKSQQVEKFKKIAADVDAGDDAGAFDRMLKRVSTANPAAPPKPKTRLKLNQKLPG